MKRTVFLLTIILSAAGFLFAQQPAQTPPAKDQAVYKDKYKDPTLKEMEDASDKAKDAAESATSDIQKKNKDEKKAEGDAEKHFWMDFSKIQKPRVEDYKQIWHNPPQAQYLTGTCWDFSTTSLMESEIFRLTGKKVKLSEIHTVYYEYIEKAKAYLSGRGNTPMDEGSEADAVQRIYKAYGAVPLEAYPGVLSPDGRHDHSKLIERLQNYLKYVKENGYWNETETLAVVRVYLDEFLGKPPESFTYDGAIWTPKTFLKDYLKLNPDDYVSVMSTMRSPFWTQAEFKAADNWRRAKDYYNVPLDDFYALVRKAVAGGYSICIGGDVSEPGDNGFAKVAVIPSFDIPSSMIDQSAREMRIVNETTGDDHGIHLVGYTHLKDHDWYLIKDSGRSSRWEKPEGYYFYRDDYIKLKMLTLTFHKDVLKDLLSKFAAPEPDPKAEKEAPAAPAK